MHRPRHAALAAMLAALSTTSLLGGTALASESSVIPVPAAILAQAGPNEQGGGRDRFGQVLMSLGLSDDQKAKIRSIMANARQKNQNADRDTRRKTMRAAFAQIENVLTPAQRDQLHQKMQAMRRNRQQGSQ